MAPCSLVDGYDFNVEEVDNMMLRNTDGNHVLHSVINHKSTIAMLQQQHVEGWMSASRMHLLEVLSQYLPGRTEKGHENFCVSNAPVNIRTENIPHMILEPRR
jgi:hypothetical protein